MRRLRFSPRSSFARTLLLIVTLLFVSLVTTYLVVLNFAILPSLQQFNKVLAYEVRMLMTDKLQLEDGTQLVVPPAFRREIYRELGISLYSNEAAEEAGLDMDIARYKTFNGLLLTMRSAEEFQWEGPYLEAKMARVCAAPLAELLYQEWLTEAETRLPRAGVAVRQDSRFDQVTLLDNGTGTDDGRARQLLVARQGQAVIYQAVRLHGDLSAHLDDFAAVLAEFQ